VLNTRQQFEKAHNLQSNSYSPSKNRDNDKPSELKQRYTCVLSPNSKSHVVYDRQKKEWHSDKLKEYCTSDCLCKN